MNKKIQVNSKPDQKLIDGNPIFFKNCLQSFSYLISEFNFKKAKLDFIGREFFVSFAKGNARIQIAHEMVVLPKVNIRDKDGKEKAIYELIPGWENIISRDKFPIHFKIQDVVKKKYKTTDEFIQAVSDVWKNNKEAVWLEVEKCLQLEGKMLKDKVKQIID